MYVILIPRERGKVTSVFRSLCSRVTALREHKWRRSRSRWEWQCSRQILTRKVITGIHNVLVWLIFFSALTRFKHQVFRFQIRVNDVLLVQKTQRLDDFEEKLLQLPYLQCVTDVANTLVINVIWKFITVVRFSHRTIRASKQFSAAGARTRDSSGRQTSPHSERNTSELKVWNMPLSI